VHELLPEDGWLVVSVVLPATQSDAAYSRGKSQLKWSVRGDMKHTAADFEGAAASLVLDLLRPAGFTPLRVARAPYLCAGDRFSPVAALDACVVVLRRCERRPAPAAATDAAAAAASDAVAASPSSSSKPPSRAAAKPMQPGLSVGDGVMPAAGQDFLGRPTTEPTTEPTTAPTEPEVHCKPCD
jgi:hypothetical protein